MSEKPVVFRDLPEEDFPFLIEVIDRAGRVVWRQEVASPGVVAVPGLAAFYGPVTCRITTARGLVSEG